MTLALRYAVRSDVGLLREGNEDSAYAGPRLLAIADGMGGHAAGEVASAVTIGALAELDRQAPGGDMLADLAAAVSAANMRLQQIVLSNPAMEGMGTTLTAVLWSDGHAAVCHIGDSRGYLLRDGELYQITHDHTLVQSLIDEGRITEDDATTHPQRSLILRAIDGRTAAEPDLSVHDSQAGDRYLLCSDGLSGVVTDETLRDVLAGIADPEACARKLVDLAIRGGGPDNITCIVADVVDTATTRPPSAKPMLAGAAANGTDPRGVAGTNPFGTLPQRPAGGDSGPHPTVTMAHPTMTAPKVTTTAPQPVLRDDDEPDPDVTGTVTSRGGHRRTRPARARKGRRWPVVTVALVVLVGVVAGAGYIGWRYTQSQYYIAADKSDEVVIYQGVNQSVLGVSLSHPKVHTGIMMNQVPADYQQQLSNTINAGTLTHAEAIVATVQSQVTECRQWYQKLVTWQSANLAYQRAVQAAQSRHKPTRGIKGPGPQPVRPGFACPSPAVYDINPASLPGSP